MSRVAVQRAESEMTLGITSARVCPTHPGLGAALLREHVQPTANDQPRLASRRALSLSQRG